MVRMSGNECSGGGNLSPNNTTTNATLASTNTQLQNGHHHQHSSHNNQQQNIAITIPNLTGNGTTSTAIIRNNISVTNIKCDDDRLNNCPSDSSLASINSPLSINNCMNNGSTISGISGNHYYNGSIGNNSTTSTAIPMQSITLKTKSSSSTTVVSGSGTSHNNGSIRIAVPKLEESDESESELTNIENLKVNRRTNVTNKNNGPRPMSWEGELSEAEPENELMDTENSTISNYHNHHHHHHHHHHHQNKHEKQQYEDTQMSIKEESGTGDDIKTILVDEAALNTAQLYTNSLQKFQHQNDIINLKYECMNNSSSNIGLNLNNSNLNGGINSGNLTIPGQQTYPEPILNLSGNNSIHPNGLNSPLLARSKICTTLLPANPSPDSAIHSVYTHSSPSQSPLTSRHAPYTPSLSRNNSDASHSSCYSYSSEFSPTHSPIQSRHNIYGTTTTTTNNTNSTNFNGVNINSGNGPNTTSLHHSVLYRPIIDNLENISSSSSAAVVAAAAAGTVVVATTPSTLPTLAKSGSPLNKRNENTSNNGSYCRDGTPEVLNENNDSGIPSPGVSRQQLINSPCPICGDKISGFHYGIFSCESCKGFFKRTVQNRKNYVCVRGGPCLVTISTRKKCPACRFEKCLNKGMKLEAIREDRTRGGRSTYQCSYAIPNSLVIPDNLNPITSQTSTHLQSNNSSRNNGYNIKNDSTLCTGIKTEYNSDCSIMASGSSNRHNLLNHRTNTVPPLLQEIMDVEYLWQYNESELSRLHQTSIISDNNSSSNNGPPNLNTNALLASAGLSSNGENANPDLIANLCSVADHRLYKIVKWCKSLPLFKNISIDDQICLLINSWCELLLFSCCFRSIETPGEIKISLGKTFTLIQAKTNGLHACVERMLNLTDHLRRLRVDRFEYVAMKVIVLLQSDTSELHEPVKVRQSQEKALQALQSYTLAHYPETPSKFGELLLRIPELQRTCQLGKEMLTIKSKDGEDFNLLMELLRGEH